MAVNNVIGDGQTYINVYNTGNLGLPMIANIDFGKKEQVLQLYGNNENFVIEFSNFHYIMNWVIN